MAITPHDSLTVARSPPADPTTGLDGVDLAAVPGAAPVLSGFEVLGEVGRGVMGIVYRAHDSAVNRQVAVKVLQDRFRGSSVAIARFVAEGQVTGQLQHPGVPAIHQIGTLPDGSPFLAMKLIRGDTLADRLADPSADRVQLVAVFLQVAQTVGYAHSKGVIHRDLKPANVMVGAFGEVQVLDWGLAKNLASREGADESPLSEMRTEPTTGTDANHTTDHRTRAGQVMGTPAYMAPEQARGEATDARADVFALGGILCAILTGQPPFRGKSSLEVLQRAAAGELAEADARLDDCGADTDLVALCRRCLIRNPADRPTNGQMVADELSGYLNGVQERLQAAERERAVAVARVAEQRKRRRVQLVLAGLVVLVAVGGGVVANVLQQQAAEKQRAEESLATEATRQADLRQVRANALVDALWTAETVAVPRLINDLNEYRDLTGARLRELADRPIGTKPGLHSRLALLADEPNHAASLAAYIQVCRSDELLTIRDALKPHVGVVAPGLWAVLTNGKADAGKRVRAACALAGLSQTDARWKAVAPAVSELVVLENPLAAAVWFEALEPVRGALVPALVKRYPEARRRLRGGKLDEVQLAAEVSGYDLTATALVRYTTDRPAEAAEQMLMVDPRHAAQFVPTVSANKGAVVPVLKAELAKPRQADWTDEQHETLGRRRAEAAAVLLTLGEAESVWPVFAFPKDGDPTARSYLLARLVDVGADPSALIRRFEVEPDVSAKRALLVALGGFPVDVVPAAEREALAGRLLVLYREHPDPGLHGAIDWLLRQKWGKAKELAVTDAELAAASRTQVLARHLVDLAPVPLPVGPFLPAPAVAVGKDWFVNGEGQTYAVVRGPVAFTLGSPKTEPGRYELMEPLHPMRIPRTFAIGTKEVTVEQFLRFRPKHNWTRQYSPGPDTPVTAVTWYDCAAYCNWLSEREGIPGDQWCYEPTKEGVYGEGMRLRVGHLKLTGYRLPTEAEWEFACRFGAVTSRFYGRGEDLLPRYGWFANIAENRAWPVGSLRPNELGLFDMLGNELEWVEDLAIQRPGQTDDTEDNKFMSIHERSSRVLRGGTFIDRPEALRSAYRTHFRPGSPSNSYGFRPARTLP